MVLKDDATKIIIELLGRSVENSLNGFDDPEKYPKEFLDECTYFLGKMIGEENARKRFEPLYKKYVKGNAAAEKK